MSLHAIASGECMFCCEDLAIETYVEYQAHADGPWLPSAYCQVCLEQHLIGKQWQTYMDNIRKADCAAALRRVLSSPPPLCVKDAEGLPCLDEQGVNGEVHQFWYASDQCIHSAALAGALQGAERDTFWREQQTFLSATEQNEEDK